MIYATYRTDTIAYFYQLLRGSTFLLLTFFLWMPWNSFAQEPWDEQDGERKHLFVEYFLGHKSFDKSDLSSRNFQEKVMHRAEKDLQKKLLIELQHSSHRIKNWSVLDEAIFDGIKKSYLTVAPFEMSQEKEGKNIVRIRWDVNWTGLLQEIQSWSVEKLFPHSMPKVLIMMGTEGSGSSLPPLMKKLKKNMVEICAFRNIPLVSDEAVHDFLSKNPFRASTAYGLRPEQLAEIGLKLHSDLIIRMTIFTKKKKSSDTEVILRVQIHKTKDAAPILTKKVIKFAISLDPKKDIALDVDWAEYFSKKFPSWVSHTLCVWQKILQDGIPYELVVTNVTDESSWENWLAVLQKNRQIKSISPVKKKKDHFVVIPLVYSGVFSELKQLILQHAQEFGISFVRYESRSNQFFLRKSLTKDRPTTSNMVHSRIPD